MGPHFYLRGKRKRTKGVHRAARLAGTLRERHARTSHRSLPFSLFPSHPPIRIIFFFFLRRFCSRALRSFSSSARIRPRSFSPASRRPARRSARAFSSRSYYAGFRVRLHVGGDSRSVMDIKLSIDSRAMLQYCVTDTPL